MKIESEMNKFTTKLLLYNEDNYLYDSIDQLLHVYGIAEEDVD